MKKEIQSILKELIGLFEAVHSEIRTTKSYGPNEILALCLAIKIKNSTNALIILLSQDLVHDAKSILRTIADAMIFFVPAISDEKFMEHYKAEGLDRRKRMFDKMTKSKIWDEATLSEEQKQAREEIEKEILLVKKEKIRELVQKHKLEFEYYHLHNVCSSEVHSLPHTMQEYVVVNEPRKKIKFIELPAKEDIDLVAGGGFDCLLKTIIYLNNHFELNHDEKIKNIHTRMKNEFEDEDKD